MKWKDILDRNLRSALIWASVALILLITSLVENKRFTDLEDTISSVYENRLVAKGYLYKLNSLVKLKESNWHKPPDEALSRNLDESINSYFVQYAKTELTEEEAMHVELLKEHLHQLLRLKPEDQDEHKIIFDSIFTELEILAEIQIMEGKKLVERSTSTVVESRIVTGIEAFLLAGLIIYSFQYFSVRRFGKPKKTPKQLV
ncbi:MAG: hypothetical protein KI791_12935 [Cyclobacteriaceae bacterium]|nr:hypothetical protein [Cyclobacteriaceae bacterium SS2]